MRILSNVGHPSNFIPRSILPAARRIPFPHPCRAPFGLLRATVDLHHGLLSHDDMSTGGIFEIMAVTIIQHHRCKQTHGPIISSNDIRAYFGLRLRFTPMHRHRSTSGSPFFGVTYSHESHAGFGQRSCRRRALKTATTSLNSVFEKLAQSL